MARRLEQTQTALFGHGGAGRFRGREAAIGTRFRTQRFANRA
jgi:hypothetical protein